MTFEKNADLPDDLKRGLSAEQQGMVRGLWNALVYDQNLAPESATKTAKSMLGASGMVYGKSGWEMVAKSAAAGVITKVDEDKRLVFGWASIIKDVGGRVLLDRQDDFIDDESELEKSAYSYVLHSRDGGEMHVRKGVSTMVESVVLTKEKQEALGIPEGMVPVGWWIGFRVNDDRVWDEVKKGGYVGFSVHGTGRRNPTALVEGQYTDVEKRDYSTKSRQQMAEEGEALPDGSFPIANRQDLSNALQAIGRAKNRAKALEHIRRRAADLGAEDMLPDWAMAKADVRVSKRTLELLTKAVRSKTASLKIEIEPEEDDDMEDDEDEYMKGDGVCPMCGMRMKMAKGSLCKGCGYLKKGDYPGHPFRGNQHTRGVTGGRRRGGRIATNNMATAGKKTSAAKPAPKPKSMRQMQKEVDSLTPAQSKRYWSSKGSHEDGMKAALGGGKTKQAPAKAPASATSSRNVAPKKFEPRKAKTYKASDLKSFSDDDLRAFHSEFKGQRNSMVWGSSDRYNQRAVNMAKRRMQMAQTEAARRGISLDSSFNPQGTPGAM